MTCLLVTTRTYDVGATLLRVLPWAREPGAAQSACFTRGEMSALVQALDGSKIRKESWNPQRNSSVANQGVVKALSPFPRKCLQKIGARLSAHQRSGPKTS